MAKKAYIGVDGVARKIKKGYIGVDGKARKIKKAYIGIGGVARPCWSGGELTVYGTITGLSLARRYLSAASTDKYAFFCGGTNSTGSNTNVDVYEKSLVRTRVDTTYNTYNSTGKGAAAVGEYILIPTTGKNGQVEGFGSSLTLISAPSLFYSSQIREPAGASLGGYAMFAGGATSKSYYGERVEVYNASLTKTEAPTLNTSYYSHTGASNGVYAVFGGNQGVCAYNTSLTRTYPSQGMGKFEGCMTATSNGKHVVFMGGENNKYVIGYDSSLTLTESGGGVNLREMASAGIGEYATFSGGGRDGYGYSTIYSIDQSMVVKIVGSLEAKTNQHAATSIGDFVLHGGGFDWKADNYTARVTALTIA